MSILEHIDELRRRLVRILLAIGAASVFSFTFGFKEFMIQGARVYLPFPDPFDNLASQAIARIEEDLLPDYVKVIVTAPSQAFIAMLYFSLFLGLLLGMPIIIHEVAAFIGPALYPDERRRILNLIVPASVLFVVGSVFSYYYVIGFTIEFLYSYGFNIVQSSFITIDEFISFVLLFTVAFGLSFELPVVMWLITAAGIVEPDFWRKNLSYTVVALAIYGAIITPDGSGITMWFIAVPMLLLYLLAYILLKRRFGEGRKEPISNSKSL